MTIINRTQEIVRKLAEQEVDCIYGLDGKQENQYGDRVWCGRCDGTGKIARLPILREPCPCLTTYAGNYFPAICGSCLRNIPPGEFESDQWTDEKNHSPSCKVCRGAGWVPAEPSLELAFATLKQLGVRWITIELQSSGYAKVGTDDWETLEVEGFADELEATWALVEKVGEKEKL